jgi:hypothetical protein
VVAEPWHGPIVLALSSGHGFNAGDIPAIPFVIVAIVIARRRFGVRPPSVAGSAAAIALGSVLLVSGVAAKGAGGTLVPAGGGTFERSVRQTSAIRPLPVDRWSALALTYDGASVRLFVDGREVASRAVAGMIQPSESPLWIGGNLPYGEHFLGLIDEVRVYDRALSAAEIRDDMTRGVGPEHGLVAAYGFDAPGSMALDASGSGNVGEIVGATHAPGRYRSALRFDGRAAVVRVPGSTSLDLRRAMTLSAWVRPTAWQTSWRTVVQRQRDAYFLTASSAREDRLGLVDDARAALVVVAAAWLAFMVATARAPLTAALQPTWWLPATLFAVGSLADVAFAPSGTLIGPALAALGVAATANRPAGRAGWLVVATAFLALSFASLEAIAGVDAALSRDGGAIARATALGAVFILGGLPTRRPIQR